MPGASASEPAALCAGVRSELAARGDDVLWQDDKATLTAQCPTQRRLFGRKKCLIEPADAIERSARAAGVHKAATDRRNARRIHPHGTAAQRLESRSYDVLGRDRVGVNKKEPLPTGLARSRVAGRRDVSIVHRYHACAVRLRARCQRGSQQSLFVVRGNDEGNLNHSGCYRENRPPAAQRDTDTVAGHDERCQSTS